MACYCIKNECQTKQDTGFAGLFQAGDWADFALQEEFLHPDYH